MARFEYDARVPAIEGALYGLAGPPDARPASPSYSPTAAMSRGIPEPRGFGRETERRLDVSIATGRLSVEDRQVIEEHYVRRVRRRSFADRTRAVQNLLAELDGVDSRTFGRG